MEEISVFVGSDHGGFGQKQALFSALSSEGFRVVDKGPHVFNPNDDYPDYALAVAREVQAMPQARGILLCRSGEGMDMAANKVRGIRAALVWKPAVAAETRRDNDANILVIPSDFVNETEALEIARAFLAAEFSGEERHARRIEKIAHIENEEYAN